MKLFFFVVARVLGLTLTLSADWRRWPWVNPGCLSVSSLLVRSCVALR